MPNIRRITILLVIIFCFIAGYAARTTLSGFTLVDSSDSSRLGGQVVSARLDGGQVDLRPAETLIQVLYNLKDLYVEQIKPEDQGKMTYDMLKAMLGSLNDPNSRFITPEEKKIIVDSLNGKFHGIAAITSIKSIKTGGVDEEHLIIETVIPGGAAAEAGLVSGDDIVGIGEKSILPYDPYGRASKMFLSYKDDGNTSTRNIIKKKLESEQTRIDNGMPIVEAESILSTADNKELELSVMRFGAKIKIKVKPKETTLEPVETLEPAKEIGLIKINYFGDKTSEAIRKAVSAFSDKGIKSLILDLRDVYGGNQDSITESAAIFEANKAIAIVQKSRNRKTMLNSSISSENNWTGKVAVLVNKGTARLPELLANSLSKNINAPIIGQSTAGDPADVSLFELSDGSAVTLRTGKYLSADGIDITGKGISVDYQVAVGGNKNYLDQAVKILNSKAAE